MRARAIECAELLYRARRLLAITSKADRYYDARMLARQAVVVAESALRDLGLDPGDTTEDADSLKLALLREPTLTWPDEGEA